MVKADALVGRAKKIMMGLLLATGVHALAYQNLIVLDGRNSCLKITNGEISQLSTEGTMSAVNDTEFFPSWPSDDQFLEYQNLQMFELSEHIIVVENIDLNEISIKCDGEGDFKINGNKVTMGGPESGINLALKGSKITCVRKDIIQRPIQIHLTAPPADVDYRAIAEGLIESVTSGSPAPLIRPMVREIVRNFCTTL
jgi:hypothetical protein